MRFITLNMISNSVRHPSATQANPVAEAPAPAPAEDEGYNEEESEALEVYSEPEVSVTETTTPVTINVDALRAFYTRINAKPGTLLTFTNGSYFSVTDSYDEVKTAVQPN